MRVTRAEWQPVTLTLSSKRRMLANGDVAIRYGGFSAKAFAVNIHGVSRKPRSGK